MKIAVTGHRPQRLSDPPCWDPEHPLRVAIRGRLCLELGLITGAAGYRIDDPVERRKEITCITGMAQGVDQDFARVALDLGCIVAAVLPCYGQDEKWPLVARARYHGLLGEILENNGIVHITEKAPWSPGCESKRNCAMVSMADHLIAVSNGDPHTGTAQTMDLAQMMWYPDEHEWNYERMTVIDPSTLLVERT